MSIVDDILKRDLTQETLNREFAKSPPLDINAPHPVLGLTPLAAACLNGSVHKVKLLLDNNASVEALSHFGRNPLWYLVRGTMPQATRVEILRLLVEQGVDVNHKELKGNRTPLMALVLRGDSDAELIRLLVDAGATLDARDNAGETVFDLARRANNPDAARALRRQLRRLHGGVLHFTLSGASRAIAERALSVASLMDRALASVGRGCARFWMKVAGLKSRLQFSGMRLFYQSTVRRHGETPHRSAASRTANPSSASSPASPHARPPAVPASAATASVSASASASASATATTTAAPGVQNIIIVNNHPGMSGVHFPPAQEFGDRRGKRATVEEVEDEDGAENVVGGQETPGDAPREPVRGGESGATAVPDGLGRETVFPDHSDETFSGETVMGEEDEETGAETPEEVVREDAEEEVVEEVSEEAFVEEAARESGEAVDERVVEEDQGDEAAMAVNEKMYTEGLFDYLDKTGLNEFYGKDHPRIKSLAHNAARMTQSKDKPLKKVEAIEGLTKLNLYDVVIFCDDSGSMATDNRIFSQRSLVQRITRIATYISLPADGVGVCFINNPKRGDGLRENQVRELMEDVRPGGSTPLAKRLRERVLTPLVYRPLEQGRRLERPLVISVITDGSPDGGPEGVQEFREALLECKRRLEKAGLPITTVRFQIGQIGCDLKAGAFLHQLNEKPELKPILYCTSDELDKKFESFKKNEEELEMWLLATIMGPVMNGVGPPNHDVD